MANSILKKSFDDGIYIIPLKLNCLTYFLYSNYLFKIGDVLSVEDILDDEIKRNEELLERAKRIIIYRRCK